MESNQHLAEYRNFHRKGNISQTDRYVTHTHAHMYSIHIFVYILQNILRCLIHYIFKKYIILQSFEIRCYL